MDSGWFRYTIILCFVCGFLSCTKKQGQLKELPIETASPALTPVTVEVNENIGGYYQALPSKYETGNETYPVIVFIHGGGGYGNGNAGLPVLLKEGIPKLLDNKLFPPEFIVNGSHYSFIHLAPQFRNYPSPSDIRFFIKYATDHFRIDTDRIYLAGMSLGGRFVCDAAAAYPSLFAAIVPMAGVSDTFNVMWKCAELAKANLPVWAFHNDNDQVFSLDLTRHYVELINFFHPAVPARLTIFSSMGLLGHDAWTRATNPGYKEDNMNIYEWMLQYKRPLN